MALTLAAALGLAACGSNSSGPSFSSTITDSAAADLGSTADGFAGNLVSVFDFQGTAIGLSPKASPRAVALLNGAWMAATHSQVPRYTIKGIATPPVLQLSSASGCNGGNYITTSGDSSDADGDGIMANYTTTISCDSTLPNGSVVSYHGTVLIQDVPGLYGFHFSANLTESLTDSAHNNTTIAINATEDAAFTANLAQDHVNLTVTESFKTGAGVTTGIGEHYNWDASFTPTSGSLAVGSPLPDGAIHFAGGFYILDLGNAANNFSFNIETTTDLAYSSACEGESDPFTDGVIKGFLNGKADVGFTITYDNGCGNAPTIVGHGNSI
ncbi:MAG TPA: hypothetical protein VFI39_01240 [Gemmatimonadales bacterium]|nr:hypothetical protein [Gemmatimonadales bacterium]